VVSGVLAADTVLTAENLERRFEVSRTVVREAVKVLRSKGLLDARPKIGTVVLGRAHWNLLDADVIAWHQDSESNLGLTRDLEEMRSVFEPWAARTAAGRRTAEDLATLDDAFDGMTRGVAGGHVGDIAVIEADLLFHRALLAATQNEFMSRLGELFAPALRLRNELTHSHPHDDSFLDLHRAVLDAVRAQRAGEAEKAMHKLLLASAQDSAAVGAKGRAP
jgi:DNA-binding FadR family transcriptional regulator